MGVRLYRFLGVIQFFYHCHNGLRLGKISIPMLPIILFFSILILEKELSCYVNFNVNFNVNFTEASLGNVGEQANVKLYNVSRTRLIKVVF